MIRKKNCDIKHCKGLLGNKGNFGGQFLLPQSPANTECLGNCQKSRILHSPEISGTSLDLFLVTIMSRFLLKNGTCKWILNSYFS